jgi:radical SAM/Cys-rich protein
MTATFEQALHRHGLSPLARAAPTWLQVNLGRRCNQACRHCHVDAGPTRTERLSDAGVDAVLDALRANPGLTQLDLTGGAPELHPQFRRLVRGARAMGRDVIDRCNLTILSEPGQDDLAAFLADQGVQVVSSLPCYSEANVDQQRGDGVFARSIDGLRRLNALGYGSGEGLVLDLVYNPVGAHLPPAQAALQADYQRRLLADFGVVFDQLLTITNMPIARFLSDLRRQGKAADYQRLLLESFNPATVEGLMCRQLISVGWDGRLFDCDFNQMLGLEPPGPPRTIFDLGPTAVWEGRPIATGAHCFGCTAGAGSSCGGALD